MVVSEPICVVVNALTATVVSAATWLAVKPLIWVVENETRSVVLRLAIALVDKHNAKKKQTTSLRFAPVATPTGGGLMLGGSW